MWPTYKSVRQRVIQKWNSRAYRITAAQVLGQLCLLAATPMLTRLFAPAEMGAFQLAAAIAVVVQPISCAGQDFVIPGTSSLRDARRGLAIGWAALTGTSLMLICAATVLYVQSSGAVQTVSMVALLVLAYSSSLLDNAVLIRFERFNQLALRNVLSGFLAGSLQVVGSIFWPNPVILAIAVLLGRVVSIALTRASIAGAHSQCNGLRRASPEVDGRSTSRLLKVGMTSGGAQLMSVASLQSLTIIAGLVYGVVPAALIGLAIRSAALPIGLLGQALSQIGQAKVAPLVRSDGVAVADEVKRLIRLLSFVCLVLLIGLAVGAPALASPILGVEWSQVGVIVSVLAAPFALQVLLTPLYPIFVLIRRHYLLLRLQAARLLLGAGALGFVAFAGGSLLVAVTTFAVVEVLLGLLTIGLVIRGSAGFDSARADVVEIGDGKNGKG